MPSDVALSDPQDSPLAYEQFDSEIKRREFRLTGLVRNFWFNAKKLLRSAGFEKLGPVAKLHALDNSNVSRSKRIDSSRQERLSISRNRPDARSGA